jgi:hypothetical protein
MFFREIKHPFVTNDMISTGDDPPIFFEFIEGEKGYWERRERKDWSDLPNLWGPWSDM